MIDIKTLNEISTMAAGGRILAEVLGNVLSKIKPGVSELDLDLLAEKLIREKGAQPAFKRVKGYSHSICVSTNEVVVHGIPGNYRFEAGDVVGVDCGVYYKGFNTDAAETIEVKSNKFKVISSNSEANKFLKTGKRALEEAIKVAKVGNRIGNISNTIQEIVEREGYSVVRSLVGHGVGRQLHEEPEVPGFLATKIENTLSLQAGMVIAVEVIYSMGKPDVDFSNHDGWTIKSKDNSLSGLFERTIAITKDGSIVLTQL